MHMTEARKRQGELYLRDWLETPRGKRVDDSYTLNVHKIYDTALLQELLKFNHKGNFDRGMSLIVGMYMMNEMHNSIVKDQVKPAHLEWFDQIYTGDVRTDTENEPGGITHI